MAGRLAKGTGAGAWAGGAGEEGGLAGLGGVVLLHEASMSPRTTADSSVGSSDGMRAGSASTGHNAGFGSSPPRDQRMWVIYLNVAIAVAIVAFFIVWTMRGRK